MTSPSYAADCVVLFGQGRLPASPNSEINDRWNRLNFTFHDALSQQLSENGGTIVPVFTTVQAPDAATGPDRARQAAVKAGCSRVLRSTVFSDTQGRTEELVFALAAEPIASSADADSMGADAYSKEYRFPVTATSLQGVVPSRIAARAVRDLPEQWKR